MINIRLKRFSKKKITKKSPTIVSFGFSQPLHSGWWRVLESIPAVITLDYNLDKLPVHHAASKIALLFYAGGLSYCLVTNKIPPTTPY